MNPNLEISQHPNVPDNVRKWVQLMNESETILLNNPNLKNSDVERLKELRRKYAYWRYKNWCSKWDTKPKNYEQFKLLDL